MSWEALVCCAIPLVVFGVMALFGWKPNKRRVLEGHSEKDYEYSRKECGL